MKVFVAKAPDPKTLYPPNIVGKYEQVVEVVEGKPDQPEGVASLAFKNSSEWKEKV